MAKIKVVRLEPYPPEKANSWAVGFVVTCSNNRTFYTDTIISFADAKTEEEAVDKAIASLRDTISAKVDELEKKPSLIGTEVSL